MEPVDVGGVPCEWIRAEGSRHDTALIVVHGGGFNAGSLASHRGLAGRLSAGSGLSALTVDYRLAPEHPFPAAVEDVTAVCRWVSLTMHRFAMVGDSAGAGIALASALALREAHLPMPRALALLSPWVDLTLSNRSWWDRAETDHGLDLAAAETMVVLYLDGADATSAVASPVLGDLRRLPPLFVQVGGAEVLFGDAQLLAERAGHHGVPVTWSEWPGKSHGFHFADNSEAAAAITEVGSFLRPFSEVP